VSKTFGAEAVAEAHAEGQRAFGENYIQEGVDKVLACQALGLAGLEWHCIGPVQSNKTRLVAEHFGWVHSVDRLKIAQRLAEQRPAHLPPLQLCLQVNVDGEASKSGVAPAELVALALEVAALQSTGRITLRGLMSIPAPRASDDSPLDERLAAQREPHQVLRRLLEACRDTLAAKGLSTAHFNVLSMGMSDDLEAAVAEGSTLVRVGRGIFGSRDKPGAAQAPLTTKDST
jgi:hypothetical protein